MSRERAWSASAEALATAMLSSRPISQRRAFIHVIWFVALWIEYGRVLRACLRIFRRLAHIRMVFVVGLDVRRSPRVLLCLRLVAGCLLSIRLAGRLLMVAFVMLWFRGMAVVVLAPARFGCPGVLAGSLCMWHV